MEFIRKYGVIAVLLVGAVIALGYSAGKRAALDDNARSGDERAAVEADKG